MGLIDRLSEVHGYPLLDERNFEQFLQANRDLVLFFPGDPNRYRESLDVAVILPELIGALDRRLCPAVVSREHEDQVAGRFHVQRWPSLVFVRQGAYLGQISRVQNWQDYLDLSRQILESEPNQGPGAAIPAVSV